MDHLFVIDEVAKLHPQLDSSLKMSRALAGRGERIWTCDANTLRWEAKGPEGETISLHNGRHERRALHSFDAIHMRKDPPYDLNYITMLWMLDAAETRVYNNAQGLLRLNEKIGIMEFPEYRDPALLCSDAASARVFVASVCSGDAVLKPLALYGGKGIQRIDASFDFETFFSENPAFYLIQPFNDSIYQGEVRAFTVHGKAIAWCRKQPLKGHFMANSNFGSTRHRYQPSKAESEMVEDMARRLQEKYQIAVVGFDLIGGKVSEINVTSPRLLHAEDDTTPYYEHFADLILEDLRSSP